MLLLGSLQLIAANINHVKSVTAISEVFGDGQKVTTVAIEYDKFIDRRSLSTTSYIVEGKEITKVYTNDKAEKTDKSVKGNYVIIEVKAEMAIPNFPKPEEQKMMEGPKAGEAWKSDKKKERKPAITNAVVTQLSDISTVDGDVYKASADIMKSNIERCLIVEDFKQMEFNDSKTGVVLKYNIFFPKNYNPSRKYPMVLFIHDASGAGKDKDVKRTLIQGLGAVVWASPSEQAKHQCIVVAPQYQQVTVDDNFNTTSELDATVNLVYDLTNQYSLDTKRIYITGQSMGCMSSFVLLLRYPQLFAAGMMVAGQWNSKVMAPLANKKMWILNSEGDIKSSNGIKEAIEIWKANGAKVTEAKWDLLPSEAQKSRDVADMISKGGNINYSQFKGGSHNFTWWIAYSISGVRDWLFKQIKD